MISPLLTSKNQNGQRKSAPFFGYFYQLHLAIMRDGGSYLGHDLTQDCFENEDLSFGRVDYDPKQILVVCGQAEKWIL